MVDVSGTDFYSMVGYIADKHWDHTRISVNLAGLRNNPLQQASAVEALKVWSAHTGLRFTLSYNANDATDIRFTNNRPGAVTTPSSDPWNGRLLKATINVPPDWVTPEATGWGKGDYGFQTFLHEIGHALGLHHPGPYNYDGRHRITYWSSAIYDTDTNQYSIMSYFHQSDHPGNHATDLLLTSPMMADFAAIRRMYGPLPVNAGNTTYGAGETVLGGWSDFGRHPLLTLCIHDTGGYDRLDLGNVTHGRALGGGVRGNVIDLRAGYFSDVDGATGNLSIALDTVIEDVVGTTLPDRMTGNGVGNRMWGMGGNDTLFGRQGDDILQGNSGRDWLDGGAGKDRLRGGAGADVFSFGVGQDASSLRPALTVSRIIWQNGDVVGDFSGAAGEGDRIALSLSCFTALRKAGMKPGSTLTADLFRKGTVAIDGNDFLVYDRKAGQLWYDGNGNRSVTDDTGTWSGRRLIASFDDGHGHHPAINATDFMLIA